MQAWWKNWKKGNNPILQYNDSLKTTGLAYVKAPEVKIVRRTDKRAIDQATLEAARAGLKTNVADHSAKRLKAGNIKENKGDGEHGQK